MTVLKPILGVSTKSKKILIQMLRGIITDTYIPVNNPHYYPFRGA